MIQVPFDKNAKSKKFMDFLDSVFKDDPDYLDKIECVLQIIGYSLMQHSGRFERFLILIGTGSNGKSVLLFILKMIVDEKNSAAVQPSLFGNQFHRAFLHRKLVNIVSELQAGGIIDDSSLKAIVSDESMNVSKKHEPPL